MVYFCCVNCYLCIDNVIQGDDMRFYNFFVKCGVDGRGEGMKCVFCYCDINNDLIGVLGVFDWYMVFIEMGWVGLFFVELCMVFLMVEINGGMIFVEIVIYMVEDIIVVWVWDLGMCFGWRFCEVLLVDFEIFKQVVYIWVVIGVYCFSVE